MSYSTIGSRNIFYRDVATAIPPFLVNVPVPLVSKNPSKTSIERILSTRWSFLLCDFLWFLWFLLLLLLLLLSSSLLFREPWERESLSSLFEDPKTTSSLLLFPSELLLSEFSSTERGSLLATMKSSSLRSFLSIPKE